MSPKGCLCLILELKTFFLKIPSNLRRDLAISHSVNGLYANDAAAKFVSFKTFLQLALGLTGSKYQNGFRITHTRNHRIVVNVELSRELSLAAVICPYSLGFIGSRRTYTTGAPGLFINL